MNHLLKKRIDTSRLYLRPIEWSDVDAIHEYASDQNITMMLFLPNETIEETKGFVSHVVSQWNKVEPECLEYVIILKETEKVIGGIGIEYLEDRSVCEIGWVLHKEYRNNGFTSEAAVALMEFAFNELLVQKVIAHCDSRNISSEKVMQKIGMTLIDHTGTRYYPKNNVTSGEYLYEIRKKSE